MSFKPIFSKEVARQGIVPGVTATLCCLGPLVLITLGLVSASSALALTTYAAYFIPLGLLVLAVSLGYSIRQRRAMICYGCQNKDEERKTLLRFIILSVAVSAATYLLVFYLILPKLAPVIVNNFAGR
jgi:hypothetical protein